MLYLHRAGLLAPPPGGKRGASAMPTRRDRYVSSLSRVLNLRAA